MTLVILDQFTGPSPYALNRDPVAWPVFMAAVRSGVYDAFSWHKAQIVESGREYTLPSATTAYVERDGLVAVWRTAWDTSG